MTLVWAVPVVAAVVAACVVVGRARAAEIEAAGLLVEIARLRDLRRPLRDVRRSLDDLDARVAEVQARRRSGV